MSLLTPHFKFWGILIIAALFYGVSIGVDIQKPLLDLGLFVVLAHVGNARRGSTPHQTGWLLATST